MSILKMSILPVLLTLLALLRSLQRRRRQIRFIRETLAKDRAPIDAPRVIVSLSTLPDRIANLEPTLDCLINQTRAPDEIVLALPEFSLRQQEPYVIPEYLASIHGFASCDPTRIGGRRQNLFRWCRKSWPRVAAIR